MIEIFGKNRSYIYSVTLITYQMELRVHNFGFNRNICPEPDLRDSKVDLSVIAIILYYIFCIIVIIPYIHNVCNLILNISTRGLSSSTHTNV